MPRWRAVGWRGQPVATVPALNPYREPGLHEIEETQGPVGLTPHRSRFKPGAMSRHSDVQPGMEKLAQGIGNGRVFSTVEMHRDVATPRIIPKYAG